MKDNRVTISLTQETIDRCKEKGCRCEPGTFSLPCHGDEGHLRTMFRRSKCAGTKVSVDENEGSYRVGCKTPGD